MLVSANIVVQKLMNKETNRPKIKVMIKEIIKIKVTILLVMLNFKEIERMKKTNIKIKNKLEIANPRNRRTLK